MKAIVVGDLHGEFEALNKLINQELPDYVFQVGDFGFWPRIFPGHLDKIKPGKAKVFFCDGNHEDHEELIRAGLFLPENVYHMPRGTILNIPELGNILFMGGAKSIDAAWRTTGYDWFPSEVISYTDVRVALDIIEVDGPPDIVISHTCPSKFSISQNYTDYEPDPSKRSLDYILEEFSPKKWYFGHYHIQAIGVCEDTRWECLNHISSGGKSWTILK